MMGGDRVMRGSIVVCVCVLGVMPPMMSSERQLRQRRSGQLLPERRRRLPVELDVGDGVDGVVSEGPHVVRVGVGVGDVRLSRAGGVQTDRVALRRVRFVEDIRRGPMSES
ncbi:hypothetical protein INR49_008878, partial [Caranx melampygus]